MRPAFLLAVFVLLALTLTGAGATSLSSCTTYSSCYTDYVETSYTAAGDYTHLVLRLCFNAVPTSSVMYACTWNGTKGSGCITYTANSTNITNTGASCAGGGGTYGDVYFWNLTIEDGVKYWFGFWNVTPVGCVWGKTSSCGSLTPQGAGTSWGATQLYSLGTLTASAAPDMVINMPVDGGVYNVTFTFQTNEVDLDGCDAPMTLYRRFYNSYAVELGRNDTNLTGAGTQYWSINSTQWGTGFYAIATLECAGELKVQDTNFFSLSILEPLPSITNGTTITDPYAHVCFWTPYPNATCPSNNQTVLFYANGTLFWNVTNTDEVYFCFRDWNLHGVQNIEVKSYCADGGALNWDRVFVYDFRTWAQDRATEFSDFLITFDPSVRNFLLNIGIGLAVLAFLLFGAFAVKSMTKVL